MKSLRIYTAAFFAFGLFAMNAGPSPAVPANRNLSGQYSGSVSDSVMGSGSALANFAINGTSLGGYFGFTFESTSYSNAASAANTARGMEGIFVATIGSAACSFAFKGKYSGGSHVLRGDYRAVNGCSGEHGAFRLTQQCFYDEGNDVWPNAGLRPC